ncbi:MAG: hypothetical protein FJ224_05310 [Lentisphaerae bacterium]|nr:hypothetical protein [Lentisphaerota bacterium]
MTEELSDSQQGLPPKWDLSKGLSQPKPATGVAPVPSPVSGGDNAGLQSPPGVTKIVPKREGMSFTRELQAAPLSQGGVDRARGGEDKTIAAKKKETSRIPIPGASGAAETGKRKTSRIQPVEAGGGAGSGVAPKTIRIAPAAGVSTGTVRVQKPPVPPPGAGLPSEEKRKTSRISLESAVVGGAQVSSEGPKTIRLKRPAAADSRVSGTAGLSSAADVMNKTAQLDVPAAPVTPTQRKTIKVKRPVSRVGIRPVSSAVSQAGEGEAESVSIAGVNAPVPVSEERTSPVFPVVAVFTLIAMVVLIYLQAAEAFGPDSCLTPYSSWREGPDLAWPGKTMPYSR